jgi:hypothetical protein
MSPAMNRTSMAAHSDGDGHDHASIPPTSYDA